MYIYKLYPNGYITPKKEYVYGKTFIIINQVPSKNNLPAIPGQGIYRQSHKPCQWTAPGFSAIHAHIFHVAVNRKTEAAVYSFPAKQTDILGKKIAAFLIGLLLQQGDDLLQLRVFQRKEYSDFPYPSAPHPAA